MKLVLDVENDVLERNGRNHLDPYEPTNKLVQFVNVFVFRS